MFRSMTTIRELALNLAKVVFVLKHSGQNYVVICAERTAHNTHATL
jgi:hypothetical protein